MTDAESTMLRETHEGVIEIRAKCIACHARTEKHDHTLYGNSVPGLVTKVHLLTWIVSVASAIGIGWAIKAVAFGG